jgi:hypothetical protein
MSSLFSAGGAWAEKHSEQLLSLWEHAMAAAVTGQVSANCCCHWYSVGMRVAALTLLGVSHLRVTNSSSVIVVHGSQRQN